VKVLFMTASYPTTDRPIDAIFVKEHARAAAKHADVAVLHLDRVDDAPLLSTPVRGPDPDFPTWRAAYRRRPEPMSYAANLVAAFRGYAAVRRSGFEPDVIHAHFFLTGVPAVVLGRLHHKPVVITEHWSVFLPEDPNSLGAVMTRAARFAFERAEIVLPVSDALRAGIIATTGANARFLVVPNAVDEQLFSFAPRNSRDDSVRNIVGVGDIYDVKGWDLLLDAVAELWSKRHDFRIQIVGEGPLEDAYRRRAAELRLDGVVTFLGFRPKPEVASIVRDADLLVLPSRYDNSPCVIGEALSAGVPVVGTSVGGVPELVGENDGLLARPRDPASIAAQLERALDQLDRFDRSAISRAAHARFGLEAIGRTLVEVYNDAIRGR
jgi:glycosyltransferase involved in cell wall biosynthesis